jgi:hypothetical protein
MFCGYDAKAKFGLIDYDASLIEMWEKPKELRRVWNLAVMSALNNEQISWEDLSDFKKPYTEGKEFKQFMNAHQGHDSEVRAEIAKEAAKKKAERKKEALLAKMKEKQSAQPTRSQTNAKAIE